MLRFVRLFVMICVLWCGLHVEQPAWAHDDAAHHRADLVAGAESDEHRGSNDPSHDFHHHCPSALQQGDATAPGDPLFAEALLFAADAPALGSLSRAPPLEPPAA